MERYERKPEEGRFINCFLAGEIMERPVDFSVNTQDGDINRWLIAGTQRYDNPGRAAFIEERLRTEVLISDPDRFGIGEKAYIDGKAGRLSVHLPFGERNVTRSRFCYTATLLSAVYYCDIECGCSETAAFSLYTCGRAILWVDGVKLAEVARFIRNTECREDAEVFLTAGIHHLRVYLEDIAERDTDFYFRLEVPDSSRITCILPVGDAADRIAAAERFLSTLHFDRPTFTEGAVTLSSAVFCPGMRLRFSGATEENRTAELLWEKEVTADESGKIILGQCEELPAGFLDFDVEACLEDVAVSSKIAVENWPRALFTAEAPSVSERKKAVIEKIAAYGEENINRAFALIVTGGDTEKAEELILRQVSDINARKDCSDFHLVYFPYLWRNFRDKEVLREKTWEEMKKAILGFRYWMDEPGNDVMWFYSENHALMFHTCQLLCGELFPDDYFPTPGLDGFGMQRKSKAMLRGWFGRFLKEGFSEWNSSPYFPIDSLGMANLYLQAQDEEMKDLARKGLDRLYGYLAKYSFGGYLACSAGRTYEKELFGNYCNGTTNMAYVLFGNGNINQAGKGVLALCLSDYEPGRELAEYASVKHGKNGIGQIKQGINGFASVYSCKAADYMLSSAIGFRPGEKGYQEHPLHLVFTATAQIFVNNPGERKLFGSGRPSYWAGNGILPHVWQYRGFAAAEYRLSDAAVPYSHLYLPRREMDEMRVLSGRIYVRKGSAYAMIACSGDIRETLTGPFSEREWICWETRAVWIINASDDAEYSNFDAFVSAMERGMLRMDNGDETFEYDDTRYGCLSAGWGKPLCLDGVPLEYRFSESEGNFEWSDIRV